MRLHTCIVALHDDICTLDDSFARMRDEAMGRICKCLNPGCASVAQYVLGRTETE
jgi:hypothetical protein